MMSYYGSEISGSERYDAVQPWRPKKESSFNNLSRYITLSSPNPFSNTSYFVFQSQRIAFKHAT